MATYKFYYSTVDNPAIEEEYNCASNILLVEEVFKEEKGNVIKVSRIDILADPDSINTDEALGIERY